MRDLPTAIEALLARYSFDAAELERQRAVLRAHGYSPALAFTKERVTSISRGELVEPSDLGALTERGRAAIARGEVAVVLLNGGMATRFGGVAKGAAPCLGDKSFLELRLRQVASVARGQRASVPVVLMNSFATDEATGRHLAEHDRFGLPERDLLQCTQGISLRLLPDGELFREAGGDPSPYAPGHGDLPSALARAGVTAELARRGVKTVFVSNVDNVGCELDPAVVGAHLAGGLPMIAEIVERIRGDVGGGPVLLGGRPELIEGFRLPPEVAHADLLGFNTNTFYFSLEALGDDFALRFYPVLKTIEGKKAVQFERILGELSSFVSCQFLHVSRDPLEGRFLPVKTPEDLTVLQPVLARRYGSF
jgi:UTP--glucose-1-phosphate uridylyltransferase